MSKEFKEWYKVIEIADLLGLSKVSVYNKIKTLNSETLQSLQRKDKAITYYNYKIIDMIRETSNQKNETPLDPINDEVAATVISDLYESRIADLKSEIEYLREQLDKHVKLVENEQILRKDEKEKILQLEARSKEVDESLINWRKEHFPEGKEQNKESLLKRIFKRKV